MTPSLDRRHFLGGAAAAGLGIVVVGSYEIFSAPDPQRHNRPGVDVPATNAPAASDSVSQEHYGELVPDPDGLLALPAGFSYSIVAHSGVTVTDEGVPTASDPDANGVFPSGPGFAIVNNHEVGGRERYAVPAVPGLTYDAGARGGTSTIEVDAAGRRLGEYTSLAGTHNNCAGGVTPWGTWLSCEETEQRRDGVLLKDHGYVFEVDPAGREANHGRSPVPLRFLGRFPHEAVAVDPVEGSIYETEDAIAPHGLFYRWRPPRGFAAAKDALRSMATSPAGASRREPRCHAMHPARIPCPGSVSRNAGWDSL